ncbi:DUF6482 family protein [Cellvibrio sp. OA-2007]|uniref:DUF6482 family protein n=1 Tax=Cellvibrio sp. OA-2007 TaxID=529823 RepID=UPI000785D542|nr:DUF6482 family protein [Cellvibrio sp. OA-2007]
MNVNSRALIFSYSDCVHYLAGITHEPEGQSDLAQLLKDSAGKLRKFPSLYRAQLALKEIGFNQCWLVMQSPYDEMIGGGAAQKTELPMPLAAID